MPRASEHRNALALTSDAVPVPFPPPTSCRLRGGPPLNNRSQVLLGILQIARALVDLALEGAKAG
eukprot:6677574-Pyramimonas_sp.AAC.1